MKRFMLSIVTFLMILFGCLTIQTTRASESEELIWMPQAEHTTMKNGKTMVSIPDSPDKDDLMNMQNPFEGNLSATMAGKEMFLERCAQCHGIKADGKGPVSPFLNPKPANLMDVKAHKKHGHGNRDTAWFYIITTGVKGSMMPSFKNLFTWEQRWQVITYLSSLSGEGGQKSNHDMDMEQMQKDMPGHRDEHDKGNMHDH